MTTRFVEQRSNFASRSRQLGLMLGEQTLRVLVESRRRRDVGRDLPLALIERRGNLRPGKLCQDRKQHGKDHERPNRQIGIDRQRIRPAAAFFVDCRLFGRCLRIRFDVLLRAASRSTATRRSAPPQNQPTTLDGKSHRSNLNVSSPIRSAN